MTPSPHETLSSELVRALRGRRSSKLLSRRLGYLSNVVHTWETGKRWPTAARFFDLLPLVGVDLRVSLERFYGTRPSWMERRHADTPRFVAMLLDDLRGARSVAELARSAGRTRSSVSRWLSGRTEPNLPDFLLVVDAGSLRLLDFIAELVDPEKMPSIRERWRALEAARKLALEAPWSHAVLRSLELIAYKRLPRHEPGWIASLLGLPRQQEDVAIKLLEASGRIRWIAEHWQPTEVMTVDTRRSQGAEQALREWSARIAIERMQEPGDGVFSYNVFTVSARDLTRLHDLQRAFFRQLRALVEQSEPAERVAIANVQVFAMDLPLTC